MAMQAVTGTGPASVDLTTKGRSVASWHFSNTTAAAVINLRDGSVSGPILIQVQVGVPSATNDGSKSQAYSQGNRPTFPNGVFVQIVTGTVVGSIDIL